MTQVYQMVEPMGRADLFRSMDEEEDDHLRQLMSELWVVLADVDNEETPPQVQVAAAAPPPPPQPQQQPPHKETTNIIDKTVSILVTASSSRKRRRNVTNNKSSNFRTGHWLPEERKLFEAAVEEVGIGKWAQVAKRVRTRSTEQVRSHAQKWLTYHYYKRRDSVASTGDGESTTSTSTLEGNSPKRLNLNNNEMMVGPTVFHVENDSIAV